MMETKLPSFASSTNSRNYECGIQNRLQNLCWNFLHSVLGVDTYRMYHSDCVGGIISKSLSSICHANIGHFSPCFSCWTCCSQTFSAKLSLSSSSRSLALIKRCCLMNRCSSIFKNDHLASTIQSFPDEPPSNSTLLPLFVTTTFDNVCLAENQSFLSWSVLLQSYSPERQLQQFCHGGDCSCATSMLTHTSTCWHLHLDNHFCLMASPTRVDNNGGNMCLRSKKMATMTNLLNIHVPMSTCSKCWEGLLGIVHRQGKEIWLSEFGTSE